MFREGTFWLQAKRRLLPSKKVVVPLARGLEMRVVEGEGEVEVVGMVRRMTSSRAW